MKILPMHELADWVGKEVVISGWETIAQERIDRFAEVTNDRQWVHVDVERAQRESPYHGTIAHGFLTLSLLPLLLESSLRIDGLRMVVNYGIDRLRFTAPVLAGSRIRGRFLLASLAEFDGGVQVAWDVSFERENQAKPACVARLLVRYYL